MNILGVDKVQRRASTELVTSCHTSKSKNKFPYNFSDSQGLSIQAESMMVVQKLSSIP